LAILRAIFARGRMGGHLRSCGDLHLANVG
jgi:hypothetical protein